MHCMESGWVAACVPHSWICCKAMDGVVISWRRIVNGCRCHCFVTFWENTSLRKVQFTRWMTDKTELYTVSSKCRKMGRYHRLLIEWKSLHWAHGVCCTINIFEDDECLAFGFQCLPRYDVQYLAKLWKYRI